MPLAQPVPIPGTSTSTGSSFQEETYNNLTRMSGAQTDPMDIIPTPSRQSNFEARNTDDEALAEGEQIKGDEHLDSGGSNVGGVTGSREEKIGKMSFEGGFSTASEKDEADEEAATAESYDTLLEGYDEHGKGYKKMDRQADRSERNEEFDACIAAAKNQPRRKGKRRKAKKACRQKKRASRKSSRKERRSAWKDSK